MEENKDYGVQSSDNTVKKRARSFIFDIAAGMCIGVAFIIPGFSGGSVAAILGIYERLIGAIANILKDFKNSVKTLLPLGIGLVAGAAALMFPLGFFLERYPLLTVSLFVGLAIGGIPSLADKVKGRPEASGIAAFSISTAAAALICFLPVGTDVSLFGLDLGGYALLFLVGALGSFALVVPGISGSMLLLILGYYNPILKLVTDHLLRFEDLGTCILVFGSCGLGMAAGFFAVSVLMKLLLEKFPRATYFAIIGFIIGSLPAIYVSVMKDAGMISESLEVLSLPASPFCYIGCVMLVAAGIALSYSFVRLASKKNNKTE